ncbi:MAG: DedA family protein [Sphingobacteriia bacterium]|nr:DedA family protein [Sphingobacteriia bacterium]
MEIINQLLDLFLNLDQYLFDLTAKYQNWIYLILFLIIFLETGVVVAPFLPGDSLLFAVGALAALGLLNLWLVLGLLITAAFLGDSLNYSIGKYLGAKVFERDYRLIKRKHLIKTQDFYERHGGKTILIARFIPIIRTFAPFVAGIGNMNYRQFMVYNLGGGIIWVTLCVIGGYFFGNIPIVKENFSVVVLGIIGVSLLPIIIGFIKERFYSKQSN